MAFRFKLITLALFIFGFFIWAFPAEAQYSSQYKPQPPQTISCANVRCAGSCTDTPSGPVCGPRLTCASALCDQGNQCIETQNGPQCVPSSVPNFEPGYNEYRPRYNYRPPNTYRPSRGYWGQNWRQPAYRPWAPWHGRGQYQPPRYYIPPHYNWTNSPLPSWQVPTYPNFPGTDINSCTYEYDPVCAQKTVQCFSTPCPPLQKTFGNACAARVEGYSVLSKGVCP